MQSLYNEEEAFNYKSDLAMRVYTSRLLGCDDNLVLHGGGNTSVKSVVEGENILFVKGSGWDLATIEEAGFAPVKLQPLIEMAKLDELSDTDMVAMQRKAMIDETAPNPSIEAILHAIIPYKFVDHTHSDAVVTISNTPQGEEIIRSLYPNFLIVPYVMPGFILAKTIYDMSKDIQWSNCEGIILLNHGIFTFDDDAKIAYEKMIDAVNISEDYLMVNCKFDYMQSKHNNFDFEALKAAVSKAKGYEVCMKINESEIAQTFVSDANVEEFAKKGILTPEHIIRTKRLPMYVENNAIETALQNYMDSYEAYFNQFATNEICLNKAPNWAVIKDVGTVSFGKNEKECQVIEDINTHTMQAILYAQSLGGFESISLEDGFDMEYWELEQAKLKK